MASDHCPTAVSQQTDHYHCVLFCFSVKIPDFSDSDHTPVGRVDFELKNFQITLAEIEKIGVEAKSTHVLVSAVDKLDFGLTGGKLKLY
jgi:hypothetical protein